MSRAGGDPAALVAMAGARRGPLHELERQRASTEGALVRLRRGTDPHRLSLDAGLPAEVNALVDAWRAVDHVLMTTASALTFGDRWLGQSLRLAVLRAEVAATHGTTGDHLAEELRRAADSPAVVAAWWDDLSPTERRRLQQDAAGIIGATDGVPLAVRDRVNRAAVRRELARVLAELRGDAWAQRNLGVPFVRDGWRDGHQRDLAKAASLHAILDADLVILFDPDGEGRAVAAYGDPTTADHVATVVPGISNHLGNYTGPLGDAHHLHESARLLGEGEVATVAWLGYDTPGSLGQRSWEIPTEATHAGRARVGARDLDRFVVGLAAVRDGTPAHVTVIGHSYGSRLLGEALANGLDVDDAVAVGSPGMGVNHVDELELPASTTVWAESAGEPGAAWILPGGGDDPVAHAPGHGRNPDDPAFGAEGFDVTGAHGHSSYFDPSYASLASLAAIIVGHRPLPSTDRLTDIEMAPGPFDAPHRPPTDPALETA